MGGTSDNIEPSNTNNIRIRHARPCQEKDRCILMFQSHIETSHAGLNPCCMAQ